LPSSDDVPNFYRKAGTRLLYKTTLYVQLYHPIG